LIFPSGVRIFTCSSLWRCPIAKSFGSCAGVTFTMPVPNSGSTNSSAMTGISRLTSGRRIFFPIKCL